MKIDGFARFGNRKKTKYLAVALAAAFMISGCGKTSDDALLMGTGEENSMVHLAGATVATVISHNVPGVQVNLELSKGAMVNAQNVSNGTYALALIPGDVAYNAVNGLAGFEGEPLENLRVLAACYQEVSEWAALESSGLKSVNELKGKIISTGSKASATEQTAMDVLEVLGIDASNTEIYSDSISNSVAHVKRQTADASHAFTTVPNGSHATIADEMGISVLSYTEGELDAILQAEPWYFETTIPAGTYTGQEEDILTFGRKILLCASAEMDENLAYELVEIMSSKGPSYAAGHRFMAAMQEETFLCNDLPIPLHEGAERYYREQGLLQDEK